MSVADAEVGAVGRNQNWRPFDRDRHRQFASVKALLGFNLGGSSSALRFTSRKLWVLPCCLAATSLVCIWRRFR
jgi:hypothetical protein